MRKEFATHKLNSDGIDRAEIIANVFDTALRRLEEVVITTDTREFSIVKTKLEEACFYAKKSMAMKKENQIT